MGKIGFYLDLLIIEGGLLFYMVILLGVILIVWLAWQKFKMKKVQSDFLQHRPFED